MRFISQAPSGGVFEQSFSLGEIPGVLWTPEGSHGPRPVILMGHGGGLHKEEYARIAASNQARVAAGAEPAPLIASFHALAARPTVPEWQAGLDAVQDLPHVGVGPAGYWGVSLGCGLGVPFVAAGPRVRAAVLALFDALGSADQTLHANPGRHGDLPSFETDSSVRFFARHLGQVQDPGEVLPRLTG